MSSTAQTSASGLSDFVLGSSISGGMSISGLGWQGTDFTSMVDGLRRIEMIPTKRMLKWKADWLDRQEAFKIVREQLQALRDVASKMSTLDKFMVKTAASSNSNTATATATAGAIDNSYRLEVDQIATTSVWSLNHNYYDKNTIINTSGSNQTFSYEYAGKVRTLTVPPNTTLESFKNMLNNDAQNPGVRASLITGSDGVTLQIKGMDQGEKNDLTIISSGSLLGMPSALSYGPTSMVYKTSCNAGTDVIHDGGNPVTFTFTYKGVKRNVEVESGTTLEGLQAKIQANIDEYRADTGTGAELDTLSVNLAKNQSTGKMELTFSTTDIGEPIIVSSVGKLSALGSPSAVTQSTTTYNTGLTSLTASVNTSGSAQTFKYTIDGVENSVPVPAGLTLNNFVTFLNVSAGKTIASATQNANGEYELSLTGSNIQVDPGSQGMLGIQTTSTVNDPAGWHVQHSQNARIRVDGFPAGSWLDVDSNAVSGVVEGVTFNLLNEGTCVVSVNTDGEAIEENVIEFIEAVNTFRKTILELTKYDQNKTTYDVTYAESLYEMQKGSILTGNYGIQLLSSQIKQATAGGAKGFLPRTQIGDLFSGDLFTSLSQLGIKTNATGEGGDLFGLLALNDDPSMPILSDVLRSNPQAVAEFFAAVNMGVSDSSDFSFASSMQSITKAGSYDVKYELDSNGKVIDGTAFINGKAAKYYEDTGQLGLLREGPKSSDSDTVGASFLTDSDFKVDITCTTLGQTASEKLGTSVLVADASEKPFISEAGNITFEYGGQTYSVPVAAEDTLALVAAKITRMNGNPGVRGALVKEDDGTYSLKIESKTEGGGPAVSSIAFQKADGTAMTSFGNGATIGAATTVAGADAKYDMTIYNPDGSVRQTLTDQRSNSNTFTNANLPGVQFTLKQTGGPVRVTGQKYNDADGLYIQIDNTSPGAYSGTTRIKQGKIPELLELLNGTAAKPEEGILGSKGAIQVLLDNYDKIVAGIDAKIQKETDRLTRWERTTKLRFSRLEATLKQYDSLNQSIASQVSQLGNNSKS